MLRLRTMTRYTPIPVNITWRKRNPPTATLPATIQVPHCAPLGYRETPNWV